MSPKRGIPTWIGCAVLVSTLAGSGGDTAHAATPRGCEAEIDRLRAQVAMLEREATVGRVETTRLRAELARLDAEIEDLLRQLEAARRTGPQVVSEPEPSAPLLEAGPSIEESTLADEPPVAVAEPLSEPPPPLVEIAQGEPGAGDPRAAQTLYDEGYTRFHEQRYDAAEQSFGEFLVRFPTSDLADNALFWIGECRYARGDLQGALEAFTGTVERYPEGNKVPDAMVKAGKCFEALGEPGAARDTYEELRRRFPATGAATTAAERLKTLGHEPTP